MASKNIKKNPKNRNSELFKKLTRLFSGPIVDYRAQSVRRMRRSQLDKFQKSFKSLSGQQFKRSTYNPLDVVAVNAIANQRRSERYDDFDQISTEYNTWLKTKGVKTSINNQSVVPHSGWDWKY